MPFLCLQFVLLLTAASEVCGSSVVYVSNTNPNALNHTSCGSATSPCLTVNLGLEELQQELALDPTSSVTMVIAEGTYFLETSHNTSFTESEGVVIRGSPTKNPPAVIIDCTEEAGLSFIYSSDILIQGIELNNCTQLRNSTSYFYTEVGSTDEPQFAQFYVSLYFLYCKNVTLQNIVVSDTHGTAVVMYNVVDALIDSSCFARNTFRSDVNASMGGGVYIEFSFCAPYDEVSDLAASPTDCLKHGTSNVNSNYIMGSRILIVSSVFHNNSAGISNSQQDIYILPHQQYHIAFGRGGGVSVFLKGIASNNTVKVKNCSICNNTALWGAGVFVELHDNVASNTVHVKSTIITGNIGYIDSNHTDGAGGGGARVAILFLDGESVQNTDVLFRDCNFSSNEAYYGGGVSFIASQQSIDVGELNSFNLYGCIFENNVARLGSAIDLSLWHSAMANNLQLPPRPIIQNCNFSGNRPFLDRTYPVGFGAMYVNGLPTTFFDKTLFVGNQGTALFVSGSGVYVADNAVVSFEDNRGRSGSAISLIGSVVLTVGVNSSLYFTNNTADYYDGGAIYHYNSDGHYLLSTKACFIQYRIASTAPKNWKTYFFFRDNRANGQLSAIYTSSLTPCLWGGARGNAIVNSIDYTQAFCWNLDHWVYIDDTGSTDSHCHSYIFTAPTKYKVTPLYKVIPGNSSHLDLESQDDLGNMVTPETVLIARIKNSSSTFFGENRSNDFTYISHQNLDIRGKPNTNASIIIETIKPVILRKEILVQFLPCPLGFKFHKNSSTCKCAGKFRGFVTCNNNFTVTLLHTVWLGIATDSNNHSFKAAAVCPYASSTVHYGAYLTDDNSEHFFCNDTKRTEVLCGRCKPGYGVAINSYTHSCIVCDDRDAKINWIYYLLANFLPITIFFAIIFIFSMSVTLGSFNSFIFFAQVITTAVKVDADGMIPLDTITGGMSFTLQQTYMIPYDIWNLNFLRAVIPKFCLSTRLTTLDVISLGYLEALYTLALLIVFLVCITFYNKGTPFFVCLFRPVHQCVARLQQCTGLHQSVTSGMAVFIIISYTKFTLISLYLLVPVTLYDHDGEIKAHRYYYNGDQHFPTFHYLVPAIASLCIFGILPPLLLVYPSLLRLIERLSCHRLQLGKFYPSTKLQAFLNEFHGCYRDGTDGGLDCRWFAGLYFFLRLLIFFLYSAAPFWYQMYTAQVGLFLIAAFLFSVLHPYRVDWVNSLDTTMFLILALISSLSMYHITLTWINQTLVPWVLAVQYILIFIPLVYCTGYSLLLICSKNKIRMKKLHQNMSTMIHVHSEMNSDASADEGSLADSTHVPDFLDYVQDSGRLKSRVRLSEANRWRQHHQLKKPNSERDSLLTASSTDANSSSNDRSSSEATMLPNSTASSGYKTYGATNSH